MSSDDFLVCNNNAHVMLPEQIFKMLRVEENGPNRLQLRIPTNLQGTLQFLCIYIINTYCIHRFCSAVAHFL